MSLYYCAGEKSEPLIDFNFTGTNATAFVYIDGTSIPP